jgi:ProP effector
MNQPGDKTEQEPMRTPRQIITALAEPYPRCFVRDECEPHRPIALGIGNALITAGVVTRAETRALQCYTTRLCYLKAMVAGAPRIGLDGEPASEVSEEHARCAQASLNAQLKRRDQAAAKAKAECTAAAAQKRASSKDSCPVRTDASPEACIAAQCAVEPVKPDGIKRLGLSDLKAAALQRKAAQAQLEAAE